MSSSTSGAPGAATASPAAAEPTERWERYTDGQLRRLRRGRHYRGSAEAVQQEARAAAEDLGMRAVTYRDRIGKRESLWIQFVDGAMRAGEPCPRCGSLTMHRIQRYFFRCPSCGAFYEQASRNTPYAGAAIEGVVDYLGGSALGVDGAPTQEIARDEEVVIEARYRFHREVAGAQFSVSFLAGQRVFLRSGCPDVIAVAEPEVVRFTLHVDAGLLGRGEYAIEPALQLVVEPRDTHVLKLNARHATRLRVVHATEDGAGDRPPARRAGLHWTVVAGADDRPAAVVVAELRALDRD